MSDDNIGDVFGTGENTEPNATPAPKEPETPKKKSRPSRAKTASSEPEVKRVDIILQKNEDVPPSGLFIGHNGTGYLLKPGKKANVPEFILDVLDDAVVKIPTMDDNGRVNGYEDSLRFPYQVVRSK